MHNSTKEAASTDKTEIRTSSISGKGSFATRKIAPGEYIFTLSGERIKTSPDVTWLTARYNITGDDPLQIDDELFLVCNLESKTINHSCNPNAGLRNQSELYSIREIQEGEEVTYDYSTTSGTNDSWTMKCACEAPTCRKIIGNVLTIPTMTLAKYLTFNTVPEFIKRQLKKAGRVI